MAQHVGKDQFFEFNGLNLTNSIASQISFPMSAGEIDASTINPTGYRQYLQGMFEGSFTVSGVWDDGTAATALDRVFYDSLTGGTAGGTKLWKYGPGGSVQNYPWLLGNGFVTAYEISGGVDDMVGFSATIRNSGSITHTVCP